jgi:hypothetical protein
MRTSILRMSTRWGYNICVRNCVHFTGVPKVSVSIRLCVTTLLEFKSMVVPSTSVEELVREIASMSSEISSLEKIPDLGGNLAHGTRSMILKIGLASMAIEHCVERVHKINCEDGTLLEELFTAQQVCETCISQDNYEVPHSTDWNDDLGVADGLSADIMER